MLECSVNGSVSLGELLNDEKEILSVLLSLKKKKSHKQILNGFVKNLLSYDLHEIIPEDDMQEMAQDYESIC